MKTLMRMVAAVPIETDPMMQSDQTSSQTAPKCQASCVTYLRTLCKILLAKEFLAHLEAIDKCHYVVSARLLTVNLLTSKE